MIALAVTLSGLNSSAGSVEARRVGVDAPQMILYAEGTVRSCNAEDDAVRQAVVEYFAGKYTDVPVLCLSLSDGDITPVADKPRVLKDPDSAFLVGLGQLSSRVRPGSACRLRRPLRQNNPVRERRTGRRAVELSVGPVRCGEAGRATVTAGTYCGTLCASWRTCTVEYQDGRWKVSECRLDAISRAYLPVKPTAATAPSSTAGRCAEAWCGVDATSMVSGQHGGANDENLQVRR